MNQAQTLFLLHTMREKRANRLQKLSMQSLLQSFYADPKVSKDILTATLENIQTDQDMERHFKRAYDTRPVSHVVHTDACNASDFTQCVCNATSDPSRALQEEIL